MRADDALKYAAAMLQSCTDWALDSIGGSLCEANDGHDDELDAVHEAVARVAKLADQFGDLNRYSNGRVVKSHKRIADGLVTSHVWHPDSSQEKSESWRGNLLSGDPDVPSPGIYEVTTYPATQEIHVRVVRTA